MFNFSCVFLLKVFGSIFVVLKLDDRKAKTCFFAFLHRLERFLFFFTMFFRKFFGLVFSLKFLIFEDF